MRRNFRRQRILRDRTNPFDIYDDVKLFARFRVRREDIVTLVDLFGDELEHPLPRGGSLPPLMQVLVALRFFASGAYQQTTGDLFNIDRQTVGRIIARLSSVYSYSQSASCLSLPDPWGERQWAAGDSRDKGDA